MPARRPVRNPRPLPDELFRCDSYDTSGQRCTGRMVSTVTIGLRKYRQCLLCAKKNAGRIERYAQGGKIQVPDENVTFPTLPV